MEEAMAAAELVKLRVESFCNIARNLITHFSETDADIIRWRMNGRTLAGIGKDMWCSVLWRQTAFL